MGRKTNKSLRSKNVKEYGEPKELTILIDDLGIPPQIIKTIPLAQTGVTGQGAHSTVGIGTKP